MPRTIRTWFQHADLSAEELGELDLEGVLRLLREIDWPAEYDLEARLEEANDPKRCPATVGLVPGKNHILTLCPGRDGRLLWHYQVPIEPGFWKRLLVGVADLIDASGRNADAPESVRLLFDGRLKVLEARSRGERWAAG